MPPRLPLLPAAPPAEPSPRCAVATISVGSTPQQLDPAELSSASTAGAWPAFLPGADSRPSEASPSRNLPLSAAHEASASVPLSSGAAAATGRTSLAGASFQVRNSPYMHAQCPSSIQHPGCFAFSGCRYLLCVLGGCARIGRGLASASMASHHHAWRSGVSLLTSRRYNYARVHIKSSVYLPICSSALLSLRLFRCSARRLRLPRRMRRCSRVAAPWSRWPPA